MDARNAAGDPVWVKIDDENRLTTRERMPANSFAGATLANGTPVVVAMAGAPLPATVCLKSADGGRLIELSADGGVEYFTPAVNFTTATMHVVYVDRPVTHVRITGAAADTYTIR